MSTSDRRLGERVMPARSTETMAQRLARSSVNVPSGCVEWTGAKTTAGYGHFDLRAVHYYAHRAAYELVHGVVGADLEINHKCRNKACINPDHLEALDPVAHHAADLDLHLAAQARGGVTRAGKARNKNKPFPNVFWQKGAWFGAFKFNGEYVYVGRHKDPADAYRAVTARRAQLAGAV